jgi:hypothetical protein
MALSLKARNRFIAAMARRAEAVEILDAIEGPQLDTLDGYVAGTQGSVSAVAATDSIIQGLQKLDGNKPNYVEATFSATFSNSIGALTVVVRKMGKMVMLEIPVGSATLAAATIASGATDVPAAYRPAVATTIPIVITNNGVRAMGQAVISAAGQITISVLGANFSIGTGGFDRCSLSYSASTLA